MSARIRLAAQDDAAAVRAVYAPYVRDTAISFEEQVPTVEAMRSRIRDVTSSLPWLVCEVDEEVAGYAYASRHAERAAYRWSVDVAVYVDSGRHRRGVGRALYTALLAILKQQGYVSAFAGVTLPNPASIGLHEAAGFRPMGVYAHAGYKLGSWHDVGWWGLRLQDELPASPARPRPLLDVMRSPSWPGWLELGAQHLRL